MSVVVPRRSSERPDRYDLEGIEVRQFAPPRPWSALAALRDCGADLYHSQDASSVTALARISAPRAAHVVTFRDPMDTSDWRIETEWARMPRLGWETYRRFIDNPLVRRAVRRADGLYCAARFLGPKAERLYGLSKPPTFLPSPVAIPHEVHKAPRPTVCFLGRWEGRKRIEMFFELARACPDVDFVAVGGARDAERDRALREVSDSIPNLRAPGVLDQFTNPEWSQLLGSSWILVNTSLREGLPTTFLEAAAHRCAILSYTDPDGFASQFGARAAEGSMEVALRSLLESDRWRPLGEAGRRHVEKVFSIDAAMSRHIEAYELALAGGAGKRTG